jgi:hypothetical protein
MAHGAHANTGGTNARDADASDQGRGGDANRGRWFAAKKRWKIGPGGSLKLTCDKASPARAVMLHLRACYVSKAAILTIPTHFVPVENRSPA